MTDFNNGHYNKGCVETDNANMSKSGNGVFWKELSFEWCPPGLRESNSDALTQTGNAQVALMQAP